MRKARLFLSSISARWDVDECGLLIDSGDVCGVWVGWEIDVCVVWIVSEEGVLIFLYGFSLSGRVFFLWHGLRSDVSINIAVYFFSFVFVLSFAGVLEGGGGGGGQEEMSDSSSSLSINCSSRLKSGSGFAPDFKASNRLDWAGVWLELGGSTDRMVGGVVSSIISGWMVGCMSSTMLCGMEGWVIGCIKG